MDGSCESIVENTKRCLTFITKDRPISEEALVTFLTEVDATLNSRPLTQILMDISYFNIFTLVNFIFAKQPLFFFLSGFSFKNIHDSHDIRGIHMTWYLFNSSSPLCRHLDTSRAITADSNREPLVAERKSLTTKPLSYVFSVLK